MQFLRKSVRLNTDVYGAFRYLTKTTCIEKWWQQMPEKIDGVPYDHVTWILESSEGTPIKLAFHIMRCAVKTEYCTEVHLVIPFDEDTDKSSEAYDEIQRFGAHVLEMFRVHFNKKWVITDKDLSLSEFRQSL